MNDGAGGWTVASVQVGVPQPLETPQGTVASSIVRRVVGGRVAVDAEGVAGNAQANLVNHGGPDKAVCVYVSKHRTYWASRLGRDLAPGAFGENLSLDGPDEDEACIGDTFRVGTALVQVSQPRQPCFKLSAVLGEARLIAWIVEHGSTGYYFRVLEAGEVWAGAPVSLVRRIHPEVTVRAAHRAGVGTPFDADRSRAVLVPELAASWASTVVKRLGATGPSGGEP